MTSVERFRRQFVWARNGHIWLELKQAEMKISTKQMGKEIKPGGSWRSNFTAIGKTQQKLDYMI